MERDNRSLSNILLTPRFQFKLTYAYIGVGALVFVITLSVIGVKLWQIQELMNLPVVAGPGSEQAIRGRIIDVALVALLGFVTFAILSFAFALIISHRIAGPVLAITVFIDELIKGNLGYPRRLRSNDELTVIMDRLHALQTSLKATESQQPADVLRQAT